MDLSKRATPQRKSPKPPGQIVDGSSPSTAEAVPTSLSRGVDVTATGSLLVEGTFYLVIPQRLPIRQGEEILRRRDAQQSFSLKVKTVVAETPF